MMESKMRGPKTIAAKIAGKVAAVASAMPLVNIEIMTAFVTIALVVTLALGAATANAAEHTGEPSDLAKRAVPVMASPESAALTDVHDGHGSAGRVRGGIARRP